LTESKLVPQCGQNLGSSSMSSSPQLGQIIPGLADRMAIIIFFARAPLKGSVRVDG
jgi:hypothetical protein